MSDNLDIRIYFTLKNHLILKCVLKYLDVVNRIQLLTFLKLNKGWSYKDGIITVGDNWDVVFFYCAFFHPKPDILKQKQTFPKMWIFHPNRCIFTQPLASQLSFNLSFDKSSTTVKCEKWSRVKGWEPQPCGARPLSCWSPSPSVPARTPPTTQLSRTCSSATTSCPTTPRRWRVQRTQGIQVIQKMNPSPASSTMTSRIRSRYCWGPGTT